MSADDFQTKYSSVMEGMLKGAIAETTKLFETMVDELKSEISRMKKENDDLKIRCSQFENARNQPSALTRKADPVRGPSEVSGKRDRAVQCDLVPVRTMLVEQFQPLRPSSRQNQEQHCTYDETYSLQDHTYGEGTTQMAMLFVKQGSYDSSQLVVKREETEPTVSGLVLSDEAGSLQASAIAAENEGILALPHLTRDSLQKAQKPSSESGNSQVLSIAETKGNFEDSEFLQMDKLITSEKHPFVVARQRVGVSQQHCVGGKSTEQQLSPPTPLKKGQTWEQLKNGVAQIGGSLKPEWADSRRRRPSEKAELMQHPVKEIGSLTVSEKTCSFEKEKPSESQHKSMATEDGAVKAPFNEILSANKTLNPSNVHPKERCTSVTLQDAILLVEAMNQSTEEDPLTTVQQTEAPPRTQFSPCVGPLVIVDEIPTASTQMAKEKIGSAPVASEASNEAPGHITVVMPKQSHTVTPSNTTTPSTTAGKRSGPSQQHLPHPLTTSSVSSKCDQKASHELVSQPRSVSSTICHKIEAPSLAQLPSVVSAVVAAQKSATLPCFPKATQSIPQKSTQITSVPSVLSQSTTTSTDLQSEIPARPNIRIIIPGTVSKTIVPTSKQESTKSDAFRVSSPQFIPSSKDVSIFVDTQTVLEEVAAISSKKKYKILCSEVPKPTAPVCELVNAVTQTCSISNPSVKLKPTSVSVENNLSAVVRLTRLPFPISANEAVIVSRLGTYGSSGSQSVLKEDTQGKESPVAMSTPPPQTPGLAAGDCTKLKETSFAVLGNTTQMSDEPDKIQENASLLFENCTFLEGDPTDSRPSTTIKTGQLAGNYTASCSDEEMINIAMQDLASSSDAAVAAKGSAVVVHLTPITSKNIADLHLNMTKTQFLAQLAVTPAPECSQKVSSDDSVKARAAETGTSKTQGLQNNSLVARLRSHLKTHPHARRTDPNSATETCPVTPKKGVIENVNPKGKDGTRAPSPMSPKDPRSFGNITFSEKIGLTPVDLLRSGDREAGVGPEKTAGEPSLIHSTISKATRESAPVSPRRSGVRLKARQSTRKEAAAMKECVSPKKSKPTSVSPRRYISIKVSPGFQKTKSTSVSPKRCSAIKERDSPIKTRSTPSPRSSKMTKNLSASPRWINSTTDGACPKSTIATSLGPKRTSSCRDGAIPKKAKSTVGQEKSILIENGTSPKVSIDESNSFCRRRCTLPKDGSSGKQNNGESVSFSPSNGITPDRSSNKDAKSVTAVGRWPKSVKSVSPRMTRDTASAKKPRLMLDGTGPKQKLMLDAEDLANVGKAKKIAKLKNCNQSKLLNGVTGAKTGQSAESRASCETGRKGTAKAVWTPPRLSTAIKTPPVGANQEPSSPSLQTLTLVYPPSVALLPIPVRAPPVVSPLQPLSVIGRRLLKNQCGECGRVLSSAASLESHVSLHAGRRPFSCTLCGKRFPDSRGLKRHGRVHRNGRIHICHQCGKGFVYSFGLTKHLQMVHRKIKPFMCQICNKGFFSKRDLEAHMRIHTGEKPFHCTLCEKKFARRVELNVHLRWHNGEKRHWCPFCGKGFLDFNNMKRHKFTHTGEKPHSCPHCPKRFTQSGHLKKHVKNVHKIQ